MTEGKGRINIESKQTLDMSVLFNYYFWDEDCMSASKTEKRKWLVEFILIFGSLKERLYCR